MTDGVPDLSQNWSNEHRYALNFKGVNYRTEWVELPDVTSVRKSLEVPANRTHRDGSPFYTLPIIKNLSTSEVVGDSFEIAQYLDKTYPDAPSLFPASSTISLDGRAFNAQVDVIFTNHVIICIHGLPFNPQTAEISKKTFVERAGKENWDELTVRGEERTKTIEAFKAALGDLAEVYGKKKGPFLEDNVPSYADLIVGGWLQFFKATLPLEEWQAIETWHDGTWGKLFKALGKYADIK